MDLGLLVRYLQNADWTGTFDEAAVHRLAMADAKKEDAKSGFDLQGHGLDLFKLQSDLVMQEEANLWVASGLFAAADSVLLVALFSAQLPALSLRFLGLLGAVLSYGWMIAIMSAWGRGERWEMQAVTLQTELNIPKEFAPWRPVPTKGLYRWFNNYGLLFVADLIFLVFWGALAWFGPLQWFA